MPVQKDLPPPPLGRPENGREKIKASEDHRGRIGLVGDDVRGWITKFLNTVSRLACICRVATLP